MQGTSALQLDRAYCELVRGLLLIGMTGRQRSIAFLMVMMISGANMFFTTAARIEPLLVLLLGRLGARFLIPTCVLRPDRCGSGCIICRDF